jgi:hypothetical protein
MVEPPQSTESIAKNQKSLSLASSEISDTTQPPSQTALISSLFLKNELKIRGGSLCTGGRGDSGRGFFSSTYFGEISIFGLSKDQTFRN